MVIYSPSSYSKPVGITLLLNTRYFEECPHTHNGSQLGPSNCLVGHSSKYHLLFRRSKFLQLWSNLKAS